MNEYRSFRFRGVCCGLAVGALVLGSFALTQPAHAGTYLASFCPPLNAPPETAVFEANAGYTGLRCSQERFGLGVLVPGGSAAVGTFGQWRIPTPAGVLFTGGWLHVERYGTFVTQALYRSVGQSGYSQIEFPTTTDYDWPARGTGPIAADEFILRVQCPGPANCANTFAPALSATSMLFYVDDVTSPAIAEITGGLTEGPAQRGTQGLTVSATDEGSGVADVQVDVNGTSYAADGSVCTVTGGEAHRLVPCPTQRSVDFEIDTTDPAFHEGPNTLEVCALDFATPTSNPANLPEETCETLGVYVDNSCPVSDGPDAAAIRFGFGKAPKQRRTVRYGKQPSVSGTVADAEGEPIEGATVCLSERDRLESAPEVDVATVRTDHNGRAGVPLPKGPSRQLKLTYWADQEEVEIETARLDVRARPRLRVRSGKKLSDGAKARFRIKLAGPYRAKRKVAVQALAPAGWLDFPGCVGKTETDGVYACSYRFREQGGNLKYKFRARVPRQKGYPYLQGRSRSEIVVVRD